MTSGRAHRRPSCGRDLFRWAGLMPALAWLALLSAGCAPKPPLYEPTQLYVDARHALLTLAEDPDPQVRTKAVESLAATEPGLVGPLITQSLRDDFLPVRFAAAMAAGDIRYAPAKPLLQDMAKDEQTPPKLMCAVLYALHNLKDDTQTGELARLLQDDDKWVRGTAAMVMGRMGDPTAMGPLKTLQPDERDPVVQLQVVEALAVLGDQRALTLLEAFTKSQFMEDRLIAAETLGQLESARAVYVLRQLKDDPQQDPAVRVTAAASLAQLGESAGYQMVVDAVMGPEQVLRKVRGPNADLRNAEIINLQSLAALALGKMGNTRAADVLAPLLLHSRTGAVRVAAAKAILQLLKVYKPTTENLQARPARAAEPLPTVPVAAPRGSTAPTPPARLAPQATNPAVPAPPKEMTRPAQPDVTPAPAPASASQPAAASQPVAPKGPEATVPATPEAAPATPVAKPLAPPAPASASAPAEPELAPANPAAPTQPVLPPLRTSGAKD